MVDMQPVKSSNVEAIGHDPDTNTLHVRFKGGDLYHYHDVDAEKFAALKAAPSVGSHLHQHIKAKHQWTRPSNGHDPR